MRLGYLVPQFPGQTHAFFWREVEALTALGVHVQLLSTRRPAAACPHGFAQEAAGRTRYLLPPGPAALAHTLSRGPRALAGAAGYLRTLHETPRRRRAAGPLWTVAASELVRVCHGEQLDHVHVHSCGQAAHLAALSHRLGGPAYSLTLHGDLPVYGPDQRSKMHPAAFVAVVTRALQHQVNRLVGLPLHRLPLVPMGVDLARFAPDPAPAARPVDRPFTFLTVARLQACKGHRFALQALAQLPSAHYRIVGRGPDHAALQALARDMNLADRVHFTGPLSEDQVRGELHAADAFVLPSIGLGEAAPVSVMEAMACGKPVVASIIGGTPDMIDDGVEGHLTAQGDVAALAAAMGHLAQDPDHARRAGDAARERALRQFDHRTNAGLLLDQLNLHTRAKEPAA